MSASRDERCQLIADVIEYLFQDGHEHSLTDLMSQFTVDDASQLEAVMRRLDKWDWVQYRLGKYSITDKGIVLCKLAQNLIVSAL